MKRVPRAAGVLAWTLGAVALHAVVPFELSRLDDRAGRPPRGSPARQVTGLVTVVAGAALMAWALSAHGQAAPRGWALASGLAPPYLLLRGPYRLTRNPMYAGEAVVWLGAVLPPPGCLGGAGPRVRAAFTQIVRWEERWVPGRFGAGDRVCLAEVPSWLPRTPNPPGNAHWPWGVGPATPRTS